MKKKLFQATRRVLSREALKNEWYIVVKAFQHTVFEIFLYQHVCPRYPYIQSLPTVRLKLQISHMITTNIVPSNLASSVNFFICTCINTFQNNYGSLLEALMNLHQDEAQFVLVTFSFFAFPFPKLMPLCNLQVMLHGSAGEMQHGLLQMSHNVKVWYLQS